MTTPGARPISHRSNQQLRRWILVAGVVLIVAFTGSAGYDSWRLHQQMMAANERELGNLGNALSADLARTLQAVDVLLQDTGRWYQRQASSGGDTSASAIGATLAARGTSVPEISIVTLVDERGMQRYRSRDTGQPLADVSDRPYFITQRDSTNPRMFINPPVITRSEGVQSLVISHRLEQTDGRFAGVVTATVRLDRLRDMYSAIDLDQGSSLILLLEDGTMVMRQPPAGVIGTRRPELLALRDSPPRVDRVISPVDGRPKLVAAMAVGQWPLTLVITRDKAAALRPWYDELRSGGPRTLGVAVLVLLTIFALLRQLRRLERGEQALRQSEERYALAMEAANEGHAEWNIAQDELFVSPQWSALHGLAPEVTVRRAAQLWRRVRLHANDRPAVRAAVSEHLAGHTAAIELDYRVRDAQGGTGWRWVHLRGRCVRDEAGRARRLFCAATDVTLRKEGEAERIALESRLQQTRRMEALGTLAGGIAHDFNNILGAILGFGDMAQRHAVPNSAQARHLERVMQAGTRARLLVARILDFSRSGVGERAPVRLQSVVEEVLAMLAPTLSSEVRVQTELSAESAVVLGDASQLYQVVMNLCTNAVQAIGEGGGVLNVGLARETMIEPRTLLQGELAPGDYLRLSVSDTGGGIAADVLQRMFDPFFTTKKVGEGTGLGLSVVHGIVADLNGAIDVTSRSGQGTQVTVWLPAGRIDPIPAPGPPAAEWPQGRGHVVMVVDDEQPLVELTEELLAGLGYEPVGFNTAEAALKAFEADPQRFDAVLSDEMLPGMQGSELARRLLTIRPDLPILLVSGKPSAALEQRAASVGVAGLLGKPLAAGQLAQQLGRVLAIG